MGFGGVNDFLDYVAQKHNLILDQPGQDAIALVVAPGRGVVRNKPANNLMAVTLQNDGDHYGLTSLMPNVANSYLKSEGKVALWRQGADPAEKPR